MHLRPGAIVLLGCLAECGRAFLREGCNPEHAPIAAM
jgi:hypothetical protein